MKGYQKRSKTVKWDELDRPVTNEAVNADVSETIKVIDSAKLMEVAEEGLAEMFFKVGMEAINKLFAQDIEELVGPNGKHNKNRAAYRHDKEQTKIVLSRDTLK